MTDRVVVFIDYQNVHGWARRRFLGDNSDPADGHISPIKVGEMLVARRRRLSQLADVRVYRGRPNPEHQPGAARANDRQTSDWERSSLTTVVRRNLMYPANYPIAPASEKGIDVSIAIDMIQLALTGRMDVAILFSSDNDLLPAVELLIDRPEAHVEVAAWSQAPRLRLPDTQRPWCHYLSVSDFESVRDRFDYSGRT